MAGAEVNGQTTPASGPAAGALPGPHRWETAPELPLDQLDALPGLTRVQVQLLANRGLCGEAARSFMQAGWAARPPALLDMDAAVARIRQAAERDEHVVVFGDFDVDGLTSCAVMLLALRALGIHADAYVPGRDAEGRGPSVAAVEELARAGARLIVTTDCGTTNIAEAELAARLGIDLVITDHHSPQGPLAPAVAVVNPQQPGSQAAASHLAGVGVAFRVAEALLASAGLADAQSLLESLLDLVAIGIVGDVAPMTPENWALVRAGLRRLNTRPRPGLRALAEQASLRPGAITERDISFALAPRLNAAGRMGEPRIALDLLISEDPSEAVRLARRLQRLNEERQRATDAVVGAARVGVRGQHEAGEIVLAAGGVGWPLGVIGLVASRLADEFGRPVVVASFDETQCRGSIRGPEGFNLVEALAERADLLRHFGGHAQAAGFTVARTDLDTLVTHLRSAARRAHATQASARRTGAGASAADVAAHRGAGPTGAEAGEEAPLADAVADADGDEASPAASVRIDCRLPLRSVNRQVYDAIRALAPFGAGFPDPVFSATRVRIVRCWRSGPEGRNLRLVLRDGKEQRTAFWGRQGALQPALRDLGMADVAYTLDQFSRTDSAPEYVLRIVDLRPVPAAGELARR